MKRAVSLMEKQQKYKDNTFVTFFMSTNMLKSVWTVTIMAHTKLCSSILKHDIYLALRKGLHYSDLHFYFTSDLHTGDLVHSTYGCLISAAMKQAALYVSPEHPKHAQ